MNEFENYDLSTLLANVKDGYKPKYLFFWGHRRKDGQIGKQCFSQWWTASFKIEETVYATTEHYMMAEKARLFGDGETYEKILRAPHPGAVKKLGREVRGFDERVWKHHRFDIVVQGNKAKFSQNTELKKFLLNTGIRVLVEASPVDQVWGIGLSVDNPSVYNPQEWKGLNLLGFALMKVRAMLQDIYGSC